MKRIMILCPAWRYGFDDLRKWQVFFNSPQPNENENTVPCGEVHSKFVKLYKPDYVLMVNLGCTEKEFDAWDKPKGPKYITWSTDSYKHAQRCTTSDLHLTSIPDAAEDTDSFVPLFFEWHQRPRLNRKYGIGICARPHKLGNRQELLENMQDLGIRINQQNLPVGEYIDEIRNYQYGLNIPIYPNGLPNFRSFELGACGVMPVCQRQEFDLDALFHGNIELYDELTPDFIAQLNPYDYFELQEYYNRYHSLHARVEYILHHFYGESFE